MKNVKVKKQLNLIYFSAILIPILIIGIFLVMYTYRLLITHYQNRVYADNIRVKSILFDTTLNMYTISDDIFSDNELQDLLSKRYENQSEVNRACSNYSKITNYLKRNAMISSIDVYTTNPTMNEYLSFKPVTKEVLSTSWYQAAINQSDILWKSIKRVDQWNHTTQELCLLRRIPIISTNESAVLVIRLSNNYLKNRIKIGDMFTSVSVNTDPIFYCSERNYVGTYNNIPIDYAQYPYQYLGKLRYKERDGIAAMATLLPFASKNKIHIYSMDFKAIPDSQRIIGYFLSIIVLAVIIPLVLINIFTNKFSTRVVTLRGEMHKACMGDYHIIDSFQGNDEISEVFSDLKIMIQSIQRMDSEMYEAKIQEQELKNQQQKMEFKMLSSQINPHFLYNTLETIRMKAFTEGNKDVAQAIKLLGKSMHYVLENTGTSSTTLKKELDYIETYLSIQKLRFNDRVNYVLNVQDDMDLEDYQILPLLLQPIVENAILHGLENTETNGKIYIDVRTEKDEFLVINIFDNGQGMTAEELEQLKNNIQLSKKNTPSSIGLHNINQRIKLFYGEAYGMEISSRRNEGTLICLTLPLQDTMEDTK
jgi:Putative regulator of cell autolysis